LKHFSTYSDSVVRARRRPLPMVVSSAGRLTLYPDFFFVNQPDYRRSEIEKPGKIPVEGALCTLESRNCLISPVPLPKRGDGSGEAEGPPVNQSHQAPSH
jgi:hypothetical protein